MTMHIFVEFPYEQEKKIKKNLKEKYASGADFVRQKMREEFLDSHETK